MRQRMLVQSFVGTLLTWTLASPTLHAADQASQQPLKPEPQTVRVVRNDPPPSTNTQSIPPDFFGDQSLVIRPSPAAARDARANRKAPLVAISADPLPIFSPLDAKGVGDQQAILKYNNNALYGAREFLVIRDLIRPAAPKPSPQISLPLQTVSNHIVQAGGLTVTSQPQVTTHTIQTASPNLPATGYTPYTPQPAQPAATPTAKPQVNAPQPTTPARRVRALAPAATLGPGK